MDEIGKEEFDRIDTKQPLEVEVARQRAIRESEEELQKNISMLENPVELQKRAAAQVKMEIERRVEADLAEYQRLSKQTTDLIMQYNEMLDRIHKNLYGQKNLNVDVEFKVTHAQIATLMRKYNVPPPQPRNVTGDS